ncbi:TonB-dependent receptor plug domain-containing protein [Achromobacter xylosoxidans]
MKARTLRRSAGVLLCSAPALAAAQQTPAPTELSPITVTAQRVPSDAATLPVAVSVITAEDIAASSARTMQDLLSTQAGIHLLNTSSSTDNAIVDLRGFGMTGASNTSSWWTASSRTPTTCPRPTSAWCRWTRSNASKSCAAAAPCNTAAAPPAA